MIALSTTITYLIYLEFALHVMMPEADLGSIRPIIIRLKRIPAPARTKRRLLVASDDMFECGLKIMDKSEQSSNESAISPGSVYGRIMALTREAFGHSVHPHLFRDSAATSIACEDPAHVYITKSILGHSTLRTSERHYNHAQSLEATRCYQARILELREPARAGHDRARRKRSLKE